MPDKTIGQLPNLTTGVSDNALFILEQDETAYNLTGEQLEDWLTTMNYGYTSSSSYVASSSGTDIPQSGWSSTVPSVNQGQFLWTKTELTFGTGSPVNIYSNARQGVDGTGTPGTSTPLAPASSGVVGTSTSFARQDHVHPFGSALIDLIYPVGSIFMSVNSTNPGSWLGGTWEQIQDTFLLACGSTYAANTSGGAATVELVENQIPAHTHGSKTLTGYSRHRRYGTANPGGDYVISAYGIMSKDTMVWTGSHAYAGTSSGSFTNPTLDQLHIDATHEHDSFGGDSEGNTQPHDNMPPYLAVYVWKRTA